MLRRVSVVVAFLLLAPQLAVGEQRSEGSRVRVTIAGELAHDGTVTPGPGSHSIVGKLLAMDADYLTVAREGKPSIRVPRAAVTDLEISRGRSRGRGALIGAGIGTLAGLGWGAIENARCESQGKWLCGLAYALPVLTAPVGAIIGFAIGKERWAKASPTTFGLGLMPAGGGVQVVGSVRF